MPGPISRQQAFNQIANGNPALARALGGAFTSQLYSSPTQYYSSVQFQAAASGAGPFNYTINAGTKYNAFGYKQGDDLAIAGFTAGTYAGACDTNLRQAGQTVSGEQVMIQGIGILPTSDSDWWLVKKLVPFLSVRLSLNGGNTAFDLGTPEWIPAGGGLFGFGDTSLLQPSQTGYVQQTAAGTNGNPQAGNFLRTGDIIWNPAGQNDSQLAIVMTCERAVTVSAPADRTAVAGGANTEGTAAYAHPTSVFATFKVHLITKVIGPRSANV